MNNAAPAIPRRTAPTLAALPGVRHGFFTRRGGERAEDTLDCAADAPDGQQNRLRAARALGDSAAAPPPLALPRQTHSAIAKIVDHQSLHEPIGEADALVTAATGLALGVLTADCAPVLLAAPEAGVIGAAHAGWRGALGGVLEAVVEKMVELGAKKPHIHAAVGPCIAQRSYQVDAAFPAPFLARHQADACFFIPAAEAGKLLFDLPGYVAARLRRCGVGKVEQIPADSFALREEFFSHRRSVTTGDGCRGRQISIIIRGR